MNYKITTTIYIMQFHCNYTHDCHANIIDFPPFLKNLTHDIMKIFGHKNDFSFRNIDLHHSL